MIVLHAAMGEAGLHLWGERPSEGQAGPRRRPGRKPKTPRAEPFPYDAGFEALEGALSEAGMVLNGSGIEPLEGFLWMPTAGNIPTASSPLIAEPPDVAEPPGISPWMVTALALDISESIEFLCRCAGKTILAPGMIVGDDLSFLTKAMHFAAGLVARQQFLPGMERVGKNYFARWEPIFSGPDADRLRRLARAMPAACRAMSHRADSPPETPSVTLLSSFVAGMVDQIVRFSAAREQLGPLPSKVKKKGPVFDSIHDRWLHALSSPDGKMDESETELARFALQVEDWRRPVERSTASAFRLCFRLDEPEPADAEALSGKRSRASQQTHDGWTVHYVLQAADDPSLLVPAEYAWTARGSRTSVLKRENFNAREYLLSALGQASGICPNIEASLKGAAPAGYALDTNGAHEFLTQRAWALEQAGFGVLLPAWWTRKGTKLKLTARAAVKSPKMQAKAGLSLDTIVQFNWELALGGEPLTFKELQELAALKSPLVKVRGQWVELDPEEIQAAVDFWKRQPEGDASARQVVRMALGAYGTPGSIPFEGVRATGWMAKVISGSKGAPLWKISRRPAASRGRFAPTSSGATRGLPF